MSDWRDQFDPLHSAHAKLCRTLTKIARAHRVEPEPAPARRKPRLVRRERSIEGACVKIAEARGCLVIKLKPPPAGLPDRMFIMPSGRIWLVEFKAQRKLLSAAQKRFEGKLLLRHHRLYVISDVEMFKQWLDIRVGRDY